MNKYVADTMAIILYLEKRKVSQTVKNIFVEFDKGETELLVPAMVAAEIGYLAERNRIDTNLTELHALITNKKALLAPLTFEIIRSAFQIKTIPELHDRLIAATAIEYKAHLITNDPLIKSSKVVETIW